MFSSPASSAIVLLLVLLATSCAQIAFRHYHLHGRRTSLFLAIGLFLSIPPVTFLAVRQLGVGKVYVFTSLNYGLVAVLGRQWLGERISARQVQGLVLITLGCLLYAL